MGGGMGDPPLFCGIASSSRPFITLGGHAFPLVFGSVVGGGRGVLLGRSSIFGCIMVVVFGVACRGGVQLCDKEGGQCLFVCVRIVIVYSSLC